MDPPTPCGLADARIRELLSQITFRNFKAVSTQIVTWINARPHSFDMINEIVDMIYNAATTCDVSSTSSELLARLSREISQHMRPHVKDGIDGKLFRESLLTRCADELTKAKMILENSGQVWIHQMGSWPQFIVFLRFVGELFKADLLSREVLLDFYIKDVIYDTALSDLKIEGLCIILKTVGYLLDEEPPNIELGHYFKCANEYIATRLVPPGLTSMVKEVNNLRAGHWIPPPEHIGDHTHCRTPSVSGLSGLDDIHNISSTAGTSRATSSTTSPTLSGVSDDTIMDSTWGDIDPGKDSTSLLPLDENFYMSDGNLLVVCGGTVFRVHTSLLSLNSPVFRDKLSPRNLTHMERSNGYPCLYLPDAKEDFSTLLRVMYQPGFPARHQTPKFSLFSGILRMATKYQLRDIREQLLLDLKGAYPTSFAGYEASTILGERIFGSPEPHPNAVLYLFKQCDVTFALPYAYYTACRAGLSSLTDNKTSLPAPVLAVAIRGLGRLKAAEWNIAKNILFAKRQHRCNAFCYSSYKASYEKDGQPIFQGVLDSVAPSSGDMATNVLEPPKFSILGLEKWFCTNCLDSWSASHREARKQIWNSLNSIFGLRA